MIIVKGDKKRIKKKEHSCIIVHYDEKLDSGWSKKLSSNTKSRK